MSTQEFLSKLSKLDIKLWVDDDRLRYSAPRGVMTSELLAELVEHKADVIALLQTFVSLTEQGVVSGPVPLIPTLMVAYADQPPQAFWRLLEVLVEVPCVLEPAHLAKVVRQLVAHHDGLRLRLVKSDADYQMFIAASDETVFLERNLLDLSASEQDEMIETAIEQQWASLNLSTGPLFRVVLFELGPQRLPRMLILLHHFAADAYSVQVLLDDFQTACRQFLVGEALMLPAKTTSIKHWAECMDTYMRSEAAKQELGYWRSLPWARLRPSPLDHPEVTHSTYAYVTESLSREETQVLLAQVPVAFDATLLDVLLTACFVAFARCTQLPLLSVSVLHQNRNSGFEGIDLSRSVGSFYTSYPLFLDNLQDMSSASIEQALRLVSQQRAQVPNGGSTWHWVSYYSDERFIPWQDNAKIQKNVILNYLGQIKSGVKAQAGIFHPIKIASAEADTQIYNVADVVPHTCTPWIEADLLNVRWTYFAGLHDQTTIEQLVKEYLVILRSFIEVARQVRLVGMS